MLIKFKPSVALEAGWMTADDWRAAMERGPAEALAELVHLAEDDPAEFIEALGGFRTLIEAAQWAADPAPRG